MKRRMAILLAAVTFLSATACADRLSGLRSSKDTENTATEQETSEENTSEQAENSANEASQTEKGTDADATGAQAEDTAATPDAQNNAQGASDTETQNIGDTAANDASSATTEATAPDIVEPEIKTEEVVQPVEEVAAPVAEAPEEDDKVLDIVFMGDSQFDNARESASSIPAYTCSLLDNVRFSNLAIGGTAASLERGADPNADKISDTCFIGLCYALAGKVSDTSFLDKYPAGEELKAIDPAKVDLYVIEYGANDYINGKDLWNPDDVYDVHSYRGALTVGIDTLKSISPKAKFLICSPSYCMWYNADGYVIGDSYMVSKGIGTLSEYADICSNYAGDENIEYMDTMYATYFDLKITTVDDYLSDGLHYNEKGRQIYATILSRFIKKTMGEKDIEIPYLEINDFEFSN